MYEIKQEIVADNYQLKLIEKQISTYTVNLKKAEIVEKEIGGLPEDTKVYDKIGRLFVISDKSNICKGLAENQKNLAVDLDNQKQLYKKYQDSINEHSKHYNELLQSKGK